MITVKDYCGLFSEPENTLIGVHSLDKGLDVWIGNAKLTTLDDKYRDATIQSVDAPDKYGIIVVNI